MHEPIPQALLLNSPTNVQHIRSQHTRHWLTTGTPMCNDGRQLPIAQPTTQPHHLCQRCRALYHNEITRRKA